MKEELCRAVDSARGELVSLSHAIHDNPELGMQEHHAVLWQTELLHKHGFSIQSPYDGLQTAYRATFRDEARAAHRIPRRVRRAGGGWPRMRPQRHRGSLSGRWTCTGVRHGGP